MRPALTDGTPLTDAAIAEVRRRLRLTLSARVRDVVRAVNGAAPVPDPVRIRSPLVHGATSVDVHRFADLTDPDYCRACLAYWDDLRTPRRYLPLAFADADTFFLDTEADGLRVMYWEYLEGDYVSHFQGEEMDCIADSFDAFLDAFFDREAEGPPR